MPANPKLFEFIVDRVNVGLFVIDKNMNIVLWNNFMAINSGLSAEQVVGENLFKRFPELPQKWLERKIEGVYILKNFSFTSWEQRPFLFKFDHNRPITGGVDYMRQDTTFFPVKDEAGEVQFVCVTLLDVTDTSIYQSMLKEATRKLAEIRIRDGLTGIFNRRHLENTISKEFSRVKRYGSTLTFLLLDLDYFKKINDNYGHLAGDTVLRQSAKLISECIRDADTLGRYGGEEFGVILPETNLDGALVLAERLRKIVNQQKIQHDDLQLEVTVSIGVAEFAPDIDRYESLIDRADHALYQSKENGRNRVAAYSPETEKDN